MAGYVKLNEEEVFLILSTLDVTVDALIGCAQDCGPDEQVKRVALNMTLGLIKDNVLNLLRDKCAEAEKASASA